MKWKLLIHVYLLCARHLDKQGQASAVDDEVKLMIKYFL